MKLIYSQLKTFLPDLDITPQKLSQDLAMIGHFVAGIDNKDNDTIFDLDIKVNRGDCLGYYGIARDLATLYNLPLTLPDITFVTPPSLPTLPLLVKSDKVIRVMAVKISAMTNQASPPWLSNFLTLHGVNSINALVDLTNFVMFYWGIPNHAFDIRKSGENLVWEINPGYQEFTSLDGSVLKLSSDILMINNPQKALSLSFWGGQSCAIDNTTTDTIIEMAIYDPNTVRRNRQSIKTTTEAATRLEKNLDPELIPIAFCHLVKLILEICHGQISSTVYEYYPTVTTNPPINFDPAKVSQTAGIDIPADFSIKTLTSLCCLIQDDLVTPPTIRKDITLEEDLIEEVIRFYGYDKIPTDQPLANNKFPDITPPILYLIDNIKQILVTLGYDEIRSWPLVQQALDPPTAISTQNSINSDYPILRQSLIQSLGVQLDQYNRYKVPSTQFFEIGKIFSQQNSQYLESYSLGLFHPDSDQLEKDIESLFQKLKIPRPDIKISTNFAEIILDKISHNLNSITYNHQTNTAYELTSQIITLDANVNLPQKEDPLVLIKKYSQIIGDKYLWDLKIVDIFNDPKTNSYRYTFRASYFNTDDKTAKTLHLKTFGLALTK